MTQPTVAIVTVTYGERGALLARMLECVFNDPFVVKVIVVSNASRSPLQELELRWGTRLRVIRMDKNTGSAGGYAAGIEAALQGTASHILLLDDDNVPAPGTLTKLLQELEGLTAIVGEENAAVLGYRPSHQPYVTQGLTPQQAIPADNFMGFDLLTAGRKVVTKLLRRAGLTKSLPVRQLYRTAFVDFAQYGGLLAPCSAYRRTGLPRRDFVLYEDDSEYTLRFTQSGGKILLVTDAAISDLETSWNGRAESRTGFAIVLCNGSDMRAFYNFRNQVWLGMRVRSANGMRYRINRCVYLMLLTVFAYALCRVPRLRTIRHAIRDGIAGRLGLSELYPLP